MGFHLAWSGTRTALACLATAWAGASQKQFTDKLSCCEAVREGRVKRRSPSVPRISRIYFFIPRRHFGSEAGAIPSTPPGVFGKRLDDHDTAVSSLVPRVDRLEFNLGKLS